MPTLYDIYKNKGQALPSTVEARFADPKFAAAAAQANITQAQYKINAGNAGYNNQIASLYGKTPATTATVVNVPPVANPATSVANTLPIAPVNNTINGVYSNYDSYLENPNSYLESKGVSEANSRAKALAAMQAQIDSTNNYYADQLRQAQVRGQGNLGQIGAINARRGLLGSDFGNANTAAIEDSNQNIYKSIENEKRLRIEELYSKAETSGVQRYQDERTAIESGLKARQEQNKIGANEAATQLLARGYSTSEMSPVELATFAKGYGTTPDAINNATSILAYKKRQEIEAQQTEINTALAKKGLENVPSGVQGYQYNTKTNKFDLVANNPKVTTKEVVSDGAGMMGASNVSAGGVSNISPQAQVYIDLINKKGGKVQDYILGNSRYAQGLSNEVYRGLLEQGGSGNFEKTKATESFTTIKSIIDDIKANSSLSGSFRVRQTDPDALLSGVANLTANKYTEFVNKVDHLKGQLLKLDGLALKEIFGPQISNSDAAQIEKIVGQALDTKNQRQVELNKSLDFIAKGLKSYESKYGMKDQPNTNTKTINDNQNMSHFRAKYDY